METLCSSFDNLRNAQMEDGKKLNFDGFKGFKIDDDAESLVKKWIKFLALLIESDRSSSVSEDSEEEWSLSTRRRKTKRVKQIKPPVKTFKHKLKDKLKQNKCKDSSSQSVSRKGKRSTKKKIKPTIAAETSSEQSVPKEQIIDTVLLISDSDEDSNVSLVCNSNSVNLTVRVETQYNSTWNINSISLSSDDDEDDDDEDDGAHEETKKNFIHNNNSISLTDDDDDSEEETIKVNSLRNDGGSISLSTDDEDGDSPVRNNSNGKISSSINKTTVSNDKAISAIISNPSISLTPILAKSTSSTCQPIAERLFEKFSATDKMNNSNSPLPCGQLSKFKQLQSVPKCTSTCPSSSSVQLQKVNAYTKNKHPEDICAGQLQTLYSKEVSFNIVTNRNLSNVVSPAIRTTTSAIMHSLSTSRNMKVNPNKAAAAALPEIISSISQKVNENCSTYSTNIGNAAPDEPTIRLNSSVTITPKNRVKKLMKNYVKGSIVRKYDKGKVYYAVNLANGSGIRLSDEEVHWLRSDNNGIIPSEITIPVSASVADSVEPIFLIDD